MFVRIGCLDGKTYEGDNIPESEIQEWLDSVDGKIGSGALDDTVTRTVDEFIDWYTKTLDGQIEGFETTTITLYIDGYERTFDRDKIVWHEIVRD